MISLTSIVVFVTLFLQGNGFTLTPPAALVSSKVASAKQFRVVRSMSENDEASKKSGDLYDDEAPEYVDPLSDNMRQRLMREASTGLDSEAKQSNVILYIGVAVAVLVALGGQGILY